MAIPWQRLWRLTFWRRRDCQLFFISEIKGRALISFENRLDLLTQTPSLLLTPQLQVLLHFTADFHMAVQRLQPDLDPLRISTYYWSLNGKLTETLVAGSLHALSEAGKFKVYKPFFKDDIGSELAITISVWGNKTTVKETWICKS